MLDAAVRGYPDDELGVHVVWTPMLDGDTEDAALKMSRMFDDPRVTQYWDSKRIVGTQYATQTYPGHADDAYAALKESLPPDHGWHEQDHRWKDRRDEASPLWDVAFFYEAGSVWSQRPPAPKTMVKQIFFYGGKSAGPTGMFFADFKKPPREGDWIAEVALAMTDLMGRQPKTIVNESESSSRDPESGCVGMSVQASVIALKIAEWKGNDIERVEQAVAAMKGVMRASFNEQSSMMTVLVDANGPATADKLVEYVTRAGYTARQADDEELEQALAAMQAGGAIVIRTEAPPDAETVAGFPGTSAGRAAAAFIEAFNTGDENNMRDYAQGHRSKSSLEAASMEERLGMYRELYGDWGKLTVRDIDAHDERHVTVTVRPERGYAALALTFQCEENPPYKLDEIRIMPSFIQEADSSGGEESPGEVTVDVTILTDSLRPLQDHFNANKEKHRFIAILSPT